MAKEKKSRVQTAKDKRVTRTKDSLTDSPLIDPVLGALCRPGGNLDVLKKRMMRDYSLTETDWDAIVEEAKLLRDRGAAVDRVAKFREAEERFEDLYRRALAQGDIKTALLTQKEIVKLYELDQISSASSVNASLESATLSKTRAHLEPLAAAYGIKTGLPVDLLAEQFTLYAVNNYPLPKGKSRGPRKK